MTRLMPIRPASTRPRHAPADLPHEDWVLLNHLRMAARRCRAARRIDLFRACAELGVERHSDPARLTDTLLRALDLSLSERAVFYPPGSVEVSFDERWLVALLASLRRGDTDSAAFLLHSRVDRSLRRPLGFLASGVARTCIAA